MTTFPDRVADRPARRPGRNRGHVYPAPFVASGAAGPVSAARRALLRAAAGLMLLPAGPSARGAARALTPLNAPQPVARLHATSAGELMAVSSAGTLWQYEGRRWVERAAQVDPGAPLASGHGRVVGRSASGTLWVLEDGRPSVARGPVLAPHAGFVVLPFGVIAVASGGDGRAFAVRLEPSSGARWSETARSTEPVLPDARAVQAALDGAPGADPGHIVVLAGADAQRYPHGVLGDAIEPTRLLYLERHGLATLRSLTLPAPYVFEDLAPRPIGWRARTGLLTVRSGPHGAQVAVVGADTARQDALTVAAAGAPIGTVNRWLAPTTDGARLLAVHTPHLGGVLHEYRADDDRLPSRIIAAGVSNHALGARELDLAAWVGPLLVLPAQDRRRLRVFDASSAWAEAPPVDLPSPVAETRPLAVDGRAGCVLRLDDGSVWWAQPRA